MMAGAPNECEIPLEMGTNEIFKQADRRVEGRNGVCEMRMRVSRGMKGIMFLFSSVEHTCGKPVERND